MRSGSKTPCLDAGTCTYTRATLLLSSRETAHIGYTGSALVSVGSQHYFSPRNRLHSSGQSPTHGWSRFGRSVGSILREHAGSEVLALEAGSYSALQDVRGMAASCRNRWPALCVREAFLPFPSPVCFGGVWLLPVARA